MKDRVTMKQDTPGLAKHIAATALANAHNKNPEFMDWLLFFVEKHGYNDMFTEFVSDIIGTAMVETTQYVCDSLREKGDGKDKK